MPRHSTPSSWRSASASPRRGSSSRRPARASATVLDVDVAVAVLRVIEPALGRFFRPEEDEVGSEPVAVLGDGFWQRRFGGDAGILGQTIRLDDMPYTVIGVAPAGSPARSRTTVRSGTGGKSSSAASPSWPA